MSLNVYVYTRGGDGSMNILDDPEGQDHAGFESSRNKLWGSPTAVSLGLTLLPTLAQGDIYAEGPDMERLEREIRLILCNLPLLAGASGFEEEYVEARARNILRAVIRAKQLNGGCVVIW